MRRFLRFFLVTGLAMISAPGCGSKPGVNSWRGSLETADGITVVSNPRAPMYGLGALELAEELAFGDAPGTKAPIFQQAWYVAVNEAGEIFVMDQDDSCVKVFSKDGRHVRSIGRRGQGPGEIQNPNTIHLLKDGSLIFEDFYRGLDVFGPGGTFMEFLAAPGFVDVLATPGGRIVARVNAFSAGRPGKEIRTYDSALRQKAAFRFVPDEPRDPQVIKPFAGRFCWALMGEDTLALSEGSRYEIEVFSLDGRSRRRIRKDHDPVKITPSEVDEVRARLRGRSAEIPAAYAAIRGLWADDEHRLIVQTYEKAADGRSLYHDVFDREGRCLAKMAIPERIRPQVWKDGKMYGLEEDAEGNQKVRRFRLAWRIPY
jgi:hypothetical protein